MGHPQELHPGLPAQEDCEGQIVIADWATDEKLAEGTAAQLCYEFELDPLFAGARGALTGPHSSVHRF